MIRLIAADLDGTLLYPDGNLPEGIFAVIRKLNAAGVRFAAASGRQYGGLRQLFAPVQEQMDFICENGALIVAAGKETASYFPPAMAEEVIRDLLAAGMEVLLSAPETCYVRAQAEQSYVLDLLYRLRNTVTVLDDPLTVAGRCIKISGYHPDGVFRFAPSLQEKWRGRVHCDIAGDNWLDFTLASKGSAIRRLADALGVSLEDTMAFGDQFNDESMLDAVGHPYLMAHAPAPLQAKGYASCRRVMETLGALLSAVEGKEG